MTPEDQELFNDIQERINMRQAKRDYNDKYGPPKRLVKQRKSRMPLAIDDLEILMELFKKYLKEHLKEHVEPTNANPQQ